MDNNEIKNLLYYLALGILDLFHENDKLQEENKQLLKYKKNREKEDIEYLRENQKIVSETLKILVDNAKE